MKEKLCRAGGERWGRAGDGPARTQRCAAPAPLCCEMHRVQFSKQAEWNGFPSLISCHAISAATLAARSLAAGRPEPPDEELRLRAAPHQTQIHLKGHGGAVAGEPPPQHPCRERGSRGKNSSQSHGFSSPCPAAWDYGRRRWRQQRARLHEKAPGRGIFPGLAWRGPWPWGFSLAWRGGGPRRCRLRQGEPRSARHNTWPVSALAQGEPTLSKTWLPPPSQRAWTHSPELSGAGHGTKPCSHSPPRPGRSWGGITLLGDSCQEMG